MSLDFTALNNLAGREDHPPADDHTEKDSGGRSKYRRLENEKDVKKYTSQMYDAYQKKINQAGTLKSDIIKGLEAGEDPVIILLKALKCISLITGDTAIYDQGKDTLLAVYGWGRSEPVPLELELKETEERLAMLTRPELTEGAVPPDVKARIQRAIEVNRKQAEDLRKAVDQAGKLHNI